MPRKTPDALVLGIICTICLLLLAAPFASYAFGKSAGTKQGNELARQALREASRSNRISQIAVDEANYWRGKARELKARALEDSATIAELRVQSDDDSETIAQLQARIRDLTKPKPASKPAVRPVRTSGGVSRWRPLVVQYFGDRSDAALRVMSGESGGNPRATNGSCRGLFQIHDCHRKAFDERCRSKGLPADPYNPESNIMFAAYMSNYGRNWSSWSVKP